MIYCVHRKEGLLTHSSERRAERLSALKLGLFPQQCNGIFITSLAAIEDYKVKTEHFYFISILIIKNVIKNA